MSVFKKGVKVYVKDFGKRGKVNEVNSAGVVTSVIIDDEIIDVTDKVVTLWQSLSWLIRFFIKLFSKKN
jgi:hypothetical protein